MESHARYEQLIDELILDDEAAPPTKAGDKWQTLRAHLQSCPRCRERYDRVALAERMLHGGPRALGAPSAASFERIGAAVLAAAAKEGATQAQPALQRMVQWLAHPRRWVTGVATAAALAVLIPFFVLRPRGDGDFQARGGPSGERQAGVRAFCLDGSGVTPTCTRASQLRLTVSNAGKFRYMFLLGLDDAHAIKWYAPRPPETSSVAAPVGNDVPVGDALRLGVNHDPGAVRVYAIFSDAPVSVAEVEASVEHMRAMKLSPSSAGVLPLQRTDVVQHSVTFNVQP
jgi:hypothetical protein